MSKSTIDKTPVAVTMDLATINVTSLNMTTVNEAMVNDGPAAPEGEPAPKERAIDRAEPRPIPRVKIVRRSLGLTQEEFAARFSIPLGTLRDWEQGRTEPDQPARAYIRVIASNPEWVSRALAADCDEGQSGLAGRRGNAGGEAADEPFGSLIRPARPDSRR